MGKRTLCCMLALLCACVLPLMACAEEAEAREYTEEYFQTPAENVEGKAWLELSIEPYEQEMNGETFQMYRYNLEETNGIGFSIETITACTFNESFMRTMTLTAEQLRGYDMNPDLEPNGSFQLTGGFQKGQFDRIGIEVTGVDANGEALVFTDWTVF